eukprot:2582072-Prymnesium_polylepis.1
MRGDERSGEAEMAWLVPLWVPLASVRAVWPTRSRCVSALACVCVRRALWAGWLVGWLVGYPIPLAVHVRAIAPSHQGSKSRVAVGGMYVVTHADRLGAPLQLSIAMVPLHAVNKATNTPNGRPQTVLHANAAGSTV